MSKYIFTTHYYKFRIYPSREQEVLLSKTFGMVRLYHNIWVKKLNDNRKNTGSYGFISDYKMTFLKEKPEAIDWIKEIPSSSLNAEALKLLKLSGTTSSSKRLHYKSYEEGQSFRIVNDNKRICFKDGGFKIPKIGILQGSFHRFVKGKIKSCIISRGKTGKYFISINTEVKEKIGYGGNKVLRCTENEKKERILGLDMSTECVAVLSSGERINLPDSYFDNSRKYKKEKDKLNLLMNSSISHKKRKIKVERIKEKMNNEEKDFIQKLSAHISKEYGTVVVEDLDLSSFFLDNVRAFKLLLKLLRYKMNNYVVASKYFRSSQTCHMCGYVDVSMKDLSKRVFSCPICKNVSDRDVNAAINLSHYLFALTPFDE